MEPDMNSLLITLHSKKSLQFFDDNTSSSFTNVLAKNLNFTDFECALLSLHFHDDLRLPEIYTPIEKTGTDFFNKVLEQHIITLYVLKASVTSITKTYPDLVGFLDGCNDTFKAVQVPITFQPTLEEGVVKTIEINFVNTDEYDLILEEKFATVLGFSKKTFPAGKHTSNLAIREEFFKSFPLTEIFKLKIQKWVTKRIELDQIKDPDLSALGWAIASAILRERIIISILVDEDKGHLTFNTFNDECVLLLNPFLYRKMGIPLNTRISGKKTFPVSPKIIDPYNPHIEEYLSSPNPSGFITSNKIFVTCSLLGINFFEKESLPLLAVLNREVGTKEFTYVPKTPLYLPVSVPEAATIKIQLLNDTLELLPEREEPTVAVLHFKKRWLA